MIPSWNTYFLGSYWGDWAHSLYQLKFLYVPLLRSPKITILPKKNVSDIPGIFTAWKESKYGVFSGPQIPVFGLNKGKYGLEKCPYLDTSHSDSEDWPDENLVLLPPNLSSLLSPTFINVEFLWVFLRVKGSDSQCI